MPLSKQVLEKHISDNFIETGTYEGDGVQLALNLGFKNVRSIEICKEYFEKCAIRFQGLPNVSLFYGDSSVVLPRILESLNGEATFWLDAHVCTLRPMQHDICPIIAELDLILKNSVKHKILIDDRRLFRKRGAIAESLIHDKIREYNPKAEISYEDGYCRNDIIVYKGAL